MELLWFISSVHVLGLCDWNAFKDMEGGGREITHLMQVGEIPLHGASVGGSYLSPPSILVFRACKRERRIF